jgi:hypothetical protein
MLTMTGAVYNPGMLPTEGLHDLSLPLREYHKVLTYELKLLDGIRTGPLALPMTLENELDSARYHLGVMVAMVELQMRRTATYPGATASEAPSIQETLDSYLAALLRAKGLWNSWVEGTPIAFHGFGADGTAVPTTTEVANEEQAILDAGAAMASPTFSRSALLLGVGLSVAGLIYLMRR